MIHKQMIFFQFWIEKSCHQNQDRAKSWKNQFLNTFLIQFWKEKSCHQKQDRAKSWKNQFLNTCLNWILKRKKLPPKPRSCQKLEKSIFEYLFKFNFGEKKKAATKTKIVPKAGKNQFLNTFSNWILNRKKLPPKPRSCQKMEKINFWILFQIEFWIKESCHQNQDRAKSWKNQFLNTCLNSILKRKKLPPKKRSCQKLEKSIFEYFFKLNFELKKAATKTKIVPKAGKINFWILV